MWQFISINTPGDLSTHTIKRHKALCLRYQDNNISSGSPIDLLVLLVQPFLCLAHFIISKYDAFPQNVLIHYHFSKNLSIPSSFDKSTDQLQQRIPRYSNVI